MRNSTFILLLLISYTLLFPPKVHAYLDPGSGAYLLQMLAAGAFVGLFVVKNTWGKIKNFTRGVMGKGDKKVDNDSD